MKKLLFLTFILFFTNAIKSQVVFCPPGAEWRYLFRAEGTLPFHADMYYAGDTLVDNETVKILRYRYFYQHNEGDPCQYTLIRQKGDTVFMRDCHTSNTWQILYNFAATAGQQWVTKVKDVISSGSYPEVTHTIVVNAVTTVTINNMPLKKLLVSYCYLSPYNGALTCINADIGERMGCTTYLFNYANHPLIVDHNYLTDFLCYKDNALGTVTYSQKGCDYNVGFPENSILPENLKIYPQPAANILTIDLDKIQNTSYTIQLVNLLGQTLLTPQLLTGSKTEMDISSLARGIYFLQLSDAGKPLVTKKIVKE